MTSRKCVVSKQTRCRHCFTSKCASKLLKHISGFTKNNVIGEGLQGLVINAKYKNKPIALKVEMLNVIAVSMTKKADEFSCENDWFKIPGVRELVQKYFIAEFKSDNPRHSWVHTTKEFNEEVNANLRLAKVDVCPQVYLSGICENGLDGPQGKCDVGIIVMEKFDMTLRKFIDDLVKTRTNRKFRIAELVRIFHDLRELGERAGKVITRHGDLHDNNVVVKLGSHYVPNRVNAVTVRLIDFGLDYKRGSKTTINTEIADLIAKLRKHVVKKLGDLKELEE